jgi:hypothetical protein
VNIKGTRFYIFGHHSFNLRNIDFRGQSAIFIACGKGDRDMVLLLQDLGTNGCSLFSLHSLKYFRVRCIS